MDESNRTGFREQRPLEEAFLAAANVTLLIFFGLNVLTFETNNENEFQNFHRGNGSAAASAVLNPKDYITSISLSDSSHPGSSQYGVYDNLQAIWNFAVPDDAQLSAGDTLTIPIPDQLAVLTDDNFNIKSTAGNIFAAVHVDKDARTVVVTFNDYTAQAIKTHTVTGKLKLPLTFQSGKIQPGKDNVIPWGIGDLKTVVNVAPSSNITKSEQIFKWSWFDPEDKDLIHWRIRLNALSDLDIQNGVISDQVLSNHQIVSPITANYATFTDVNHYTLGAAIPASQIHQTSGNDFTVDVGNTHSSVVVGYDTRITDGEDSPSYGNTAKYTASNLPGDSITVWQGLTNGSGSANSGNRPTPQPNPNPDPNPNPQPDPNPTPNPSPNKGGNDQPKDKGDKKGSDQPAKGASNSDDNQAKAPAQSVTADSVASAFRIGKPLPETAQVVGKKLPVLLGLATVMTVALSWYFSKKK